MQTNCILIAFNLFILPQILALSVCKIVSRSPYWLHIKFSMSLLLIYFCDQFVAPKICQQTYSLQCLSTINMVFSSEDKILIKS